MTGAATGVAAAQRALASGDPDGALILLGGLSEPSALHLRALAHRGAGRLEEARNSFDAAVAAAPNDPQVANNYANLLRQTGERDRALALYDHALAVQPDYRDAAFNKALLLSEVGEDDAALELLERLSGAHPGDARVHSSRGAVLRKLGRHQAAATAYDTALRAQPGLPTARKGRAQIALERGEQGAAARYQQAVQSDPADLGAVHGYAEALEAEGSGEATVVLDAVLQARPDWIAGHILAARIRAERGDEDWAGPMRVALARNSADQGLAMALANTLAAADRWEEALAVLPVGNTPELFATRAQLLCEAGQPAAALALIGPDANASQATAAVAARAHLRLNDPVSAASILERAVATDPAAIGAWGLLEIAWRLTGDERAGWLSGQDGMIAAQDIGLGDAEMTELAALLRQLHRTRAHPLGQSLRGGTQTRGALFLRGEPILAQLSEALTDCVADYRDKLPPVDETHPLLRHRDARLRIGGSWSVRLEGSGFHVNHIHSDGVISSACYIALPELGGRGDRRAGWLELGRPPAELGLDLEPLAAIEPRVGRLALFPSYLFHGTRPFAAGERLSVAFDMVPA